MVAPDPRSYAALQLDKDREATLDFPDLLPRKHTRMAESPLAYLRGAAPLFYALLADHPELAEGPDGTGWLVGDAHLENFGAFRTAHADEAVAFDVNDFDEAVIGPFRFDVLRLLTAAILGGRELGSNGAASLALCQALLDGYVSVLGSGVAPTNRPPAVQRLLDKVATRSHRDLLDRRTELRGSTRRFSRGDRYRDLDPAMVPKAEAAFASYVARLDPERKLDRSHFAVEDVAFRVAGVGSLGTLRIAILARGKGQPDSRWIFDMKREGVPAAQALVPVQPENPAERVFAANTACLQSPPRMMGITELDGQPLFVRRLLPQEDKLDLTHLKAAELPDLARYLGGLLGMAHHRGARQLPAAPWTDAERTGLVQRAIVIAGVHEASYLSMCHTL